VAALAEAMLRLGADADLRRALGRDGSRRFEERFSLYNLGRRTEAFYREVLDEWRGRCGQSPGTRPVFTDVLGDPAERSVA
jgi:hypothetical protein